MRMLDSHVLKETDKAGRKKSSFCLFEMGRGGYNSQVIKKAEPDGRKKEVKIADQAARQTRRWCLGRAGTVT